MSRNNGQAAIEFLVTYGWAIMAALLVIGALSYFGITNPSTSLPDKCIFANGFECKEFIFNSTTLRAKMLNTQGETIYNAGAKFTDTGIACVMEYSGADWIPEQVREINCTSLPGGPYVQKDKVRSRITLTFSKTPAGYTQVASGEIYGTVQ